MTRLLDEMLTLTIISEMDSKGSKFDQNQNFLVVPVDSILQLSRSRRILEFCSFYLEFCYSADSERCL
jgi:hypothetical protein